MNLYLFSIERKINVIRKENFNKYTKSEFRFYVSEQNVRCHSYSHKTSYALHCSRRVHFRFKRIGGSVEDMGRK